MSGSDAIPFCTTANKGRHPYAISAGVQIEAGSLTVKKGYSDHDM